MALLWRKNWSMETSKLIGIMKCPISCRLGSAELLGRHIKNHWSVEHTKKLCIYCFANWLRTSPRADWGPASSWGEGAGIGTICFCERRWGCYSAAKFPGLIQTSPTGSPQPHRAETSLFLSSTLSAGVDYWSRTLVQTSKWTQVGETLETQVKPRTPV